MNFEQYKARRNELMAALRTIADSESVDQEAFNAKKAEIEALDAEWEAKAIRQADIDALNNVRPTKYNPLVNVGVEKLGASSSEPKDVYASDEYRKAFMNYIVSGTKIPESFRNESKTTVSTETGAVIPTTMVHEIIREMKDRGNIWNAVRHLNIEGGVEFPISDIIPVAHWITETNPSEDQNLSAKNTVSFKYYGLECKLSQSLLVSVTTIAEFEALFIELATEAIIAALEVGVFKGTGSGQMKGILNETRIPAGNTITISAASIGKWDAWKKEVFAKMKKAYRNGTFYMAQGTFDGYIDGMVDNTGQPIGRINYGIDGDEIYRFGGKTVETVEDDVISAWEDAGSGDVIAVFGNLKNYAINSNMEFRTVKWIDEDTNKVKNKVMMICDGKVLDPNGFLIIKKGA